MENVKEYLDNIRHYVGLENAYNEQLLQVRLIGYTAPISNYSNIGGSNGTRGDSIQERYMLALEKLEDEIKDKAIEYTKAITRFYEEVEEMPNTLYRLVLLLYYGSKKSIKEIAATIDKSESHTKRLLNSARTTFCQIMVR
jgi:DNA-directed RNA polymerase specialized sigma subunit